MYEVVSKWAKIMLIRSRVASWVLWNVSLAGFLLSIRFAS
jgi:hypothetical protein